MTRPEVVESPPPNAPWESLTDAPLDASALPDNVRLLDSRRVDTVPQPANEQAARPEVLEVEEDATSTSTRNAGIGVGFLSRIRSWMLVPLVDFGLILLPLAWRPPQIHAVIALALLGTLLLTGGGRYRARLHLSV